MKKILILTARLGEGENVASVHLRQAIEHLNPSGAQVETLDLLDSAYGRFDALLGRGFRALGEFDGFGRVRHSLQDVLLGQEPDVVVSTSPLYALLIEEIYRTGRTRDFALVSLVLDLVLDDAPWSRVASDFFVVANNRTAQELASLGVPDEKISVFGFPVQPTFDEAGSGPALSLPRNGARARILYLINNARKKAPKLIDRLLEHPEWDITVCAEGDVEVEEMAREKAATAANRMKVIASRRHLPDLLRSHHVVISRAETGVTQEAIAARCPLITPKTGSKIEEANLALLTRANAGGRGEKPREVIDWLERIFRDDARLLALWRQNLEPLGRPDGAMHLARFVLEKAEVSALPPVPELRALPAPVENGLVEVRRLRRLPKKLLLCDLHTHTTWSDGKLTIPEIVDFYGQRGFDCLCITDHLCDPKRLLGKLVNLTGLVIPPGELNGYFEAIEREKKRAWAKYDLMLMTGVEFNKDGYTAKTSTHLLGVDLKQPIDPSLDLKQLIAEIHAQGALAIASHPHKMKSHWGKDTLHLWEHVDEYAPLLDAWEVANRDDIFNPVGLKKLPFIASSDFHKPKHIHSWKTVLYCEKEAEAIKHCIRVNRDVSLTLYRDHRFGLEEQHLQLPALENIPVPSLAEQRG